MVRGIRRWFRKLRYESLSEELLNSTDHEVALSRLPNWIELTLEFYDDRELDLSKRIKTKFLNIDDLTSALVIWEHNLINNKVKDFKSGNYKVLLDDWLVDKESYRVTLKEFLQRNKDTVSNIAKGISNSSSSGKSYHLAASYDITTTLLLIVGIIYEQKYKLKYRGDTKKN